MPLPPYIRRDTRRPARRRPTAGATRPCSPPTNRRPAARSRRRRRGCTSPTTPWPGWPPAASAPRGCACTWGRAPSSRRTRRRSRRGACTPRPSTCRRQRPPPWRGPAATGGRVIAVGTTSLRVLETAARLGLPAADGPDCRRWPDADDPDPVFRGEAARRDGHWDVAGTTRLFVAPPDTVTAADGLLTNFHLPGSSLLMLVAAVAGDPAWRRAYDHAVAARTALLQLRRLHAHPARTRGGRPVSAHALDTPFSFTVGGRSSDTRRAPGPPGDRPRRRRDAGLHARGHGGLGQGRDLRAGLGHRRAPDPGQHLPPVPAPRPRTGGRAPAACTASRAGTAPC